MRYWWLPLVLLPLKASADPCGMVPPIGTADTPGAIRRVGAQMTYVFYKNGIESFVIRPGFSGRVEQFGMLIPFPSPPSIKKVEDKIFTHIQRAIDPPEIPLHLQIYDGLGLGDSIGSLLGTTGLGLRGSGRGVGGGIGGLAINEVRVVRQEAVGMYEVAVLKAGSASALKRWMKDHQYRFPKGMEQTANAYISGRWCFVAVKARVGKKRGIVPRPGMRRAKAVLPPGASFTGAVQAMSFRFRSRRLVVPMRLSAFNPGPMHNIVYLLTDRGMKIRQLPARYVKRQITGRELVRNLYSRLPVRVHGGPIEGVTMQAMLQLESQRRPEPHNGFARALFAADLIAASRRRLTLSHERNEKALHNINEALGLRGPEVDLWVAKASKAAAKKLGLRAKAMLENMTLTVIEGDFPRELLKRENLRFARYRKKRSRPDPLYSSLGLNGLLMYGWPKHLQKGN